MSPTTSDTDGLALGFRFVVQFLGKAGPNPIDIRFSRVSGLSATVETATIHEGGENRFSHQLPRRVSRSNLVLERGLVVDRSPLGVDVDAAFGQFKFRPGSVMVKLLGEQGRTRMTWQLHRAYPVRWSLADLDASQEQVLIDTLELAYTHVRTVRI